MKKRFIVLVDFSMYSENLIKYACDWSRQINVELLLVHQTTVLTSGFMDSEGKEYLTQYANDEALQKLKALAKKTVPTTLKVSYKVSENHLQNTLSDLLKEPFENLVLLGLKGSGILKKLFLGSISLQIIENINNIVVAIPKEIKVFSHKKIFVAVKMVYPLNLLGFRNFLNFIDDENTEITFFYLARPNEDTKEIKIYLSELANLFADRFKVNFQIYGGKTPFSDIEKVINNKIDELLVVQKGSRLLLDQFFRRYLVNHLVYKGQTPLIILP